jgi:hypothetical protein
MSKSRLSSLPNHINFELDWEWDGVVDVIDTHTGLVVGGVREVNIEERWIRVSPPYFEKVHGDYELAWNEHGIALMTEMEAGSISSEFPYLTREVIEWLVDSISDHSWHRADARTKLAIHALEKQFQIENEMR